MPSRLIQLNGMNVNAGGLAEFHENIQPASPASCAEPQEFAIFSIVSVFGQPRVPAYEIIT